MIIRLSFLLCFIILQIVYAESPIDTTLIKYIDVTGDDVPEIIELYIISNDFISPFNWTLSIKSDTSFLYSYTESDSSSEQRIYLEMEEGKKYEEIKRKFYFEDFIELNIRKNINFGGGTEYLFSKTYEGSIYFITKNYLLKYFGIKENEDMNIIGELIKKLKNEQAIIVSHTVKGIYLSLPMVYVKEVNILVPIYSD